jgi:starch synthase (maltosyl-transferring)
VTALNRARHEHRALQSNESLAFHATDNTQLMAYSKRSAGDRILVVVNLDPHHAQSGWVTVDAAALGLETGMPIQVRDLVDGATYAWRAGANFVMLDPQHASAHVFALP